MTKSLFNSVKRLIRPRWQIGIVEDSLEEIVNGEELRVKWPSNPFHDRWFADPFILSVKGNELTLLVEDYRYKEGKGQISRIIVDVERNSIVSCKTILECGHYSFPAILRANGKVYFYPEQSRQGKLELFEYDEEKEVCSFAGILSEEPLADAIIYNNVIFATLLPEPNGKTLKLFKWPSAVQGSTAASQHSSAFGGSKQLHCVQDVNVLNFELESLNPPKAYVFDECIARNAGDFFEYNGNVYRPAQECNRWYGNALSIQLYENGKFKEVRRIPRWHTLNSYQGVMVVDRKRFPFKWVYRLLRKSDK